MLYLLEGGFQRGRTPFCVMNIKVDDAKRRGGLFRSREPWGEGEDEGL